MAAKPIFDPAMKGKYIKLGKDVGFLQLSKINKATVTTDGQGKKSCTITRKDGKPPVVIQGGMAEKIKNNLTKEGVG